MSGTAAAAGWAPPTDIGGADTAVDAPSVAFEAPGAAVIVWNRTVGAATEVRSAAHAASGGSAWSAPLTLSRGGNTLSPTIAAADGTVGAAWRQQVGGRNLVHALVRRAGEAWPTTADTLSAAGQNAGPPALAVLPSGGVLATWTRGNGNRPENQVAYRAPAGSWTIEQQDLTSLREMGNGDPPQIGADADGNAVVLWSTGRQLGAAFRRADGLWQLNDGVLVGPDDGDPSGPRLSVGADGTAVATWRSTERNQTRPAVSVREPTIGWQLPAGVLSPATTAAAPRVAVDGRGNAVAVWIERPQGQPAQLRASVRRTEGSWAPSVQISSAAETVADPDVAVDRLGNAYAVWTNAGGAARAATLRPLTGGAWSAPVDISPSGRTATRASVSAATGDAVATWVETRAGGFGIGSAAFDGSGPAVTIAGPAEGAAGAALPFAATAVDAWSAVTVLDWSFGDGGTGDGPAVQHAYAQPGAYTVTLRAVDARGNITEVTRQLTVAKAGSVGTSTGVTGTADATQTPCTTGCTPSLASNTVKLRSVTATALKVRGSVTRTLKITGTARRAGGLVITLRRDGALAQPTYNWSREVRAGAFSLTIRLPRTLLLGKYTVQVTPPGGTVASRKVRIRTPVAVKVSR